MGIVSAMMQVGAAIKHAVAALFTVDYSLRFDGSADYLLSSSISASSRTTFTISAWVRMHSQPAGVVDVLSSMYFPGAMNLQVGLLITSALDVRWFEYDDSSGGTYPGDYTTSTSPISVGGWHHVVCQVDTTSADRVKIWVDGSAETLTETAAYSANYTTLMSVGTWPSTTVAQKLSVGAAFNQATSAVARPLPGQLAEIHFIDGQALDASYFGETRNSQWVPKEVTGVTYGNNGFYLPFDRNGEGVTLLLDGEATPIVDTSSNTSSNVAVGVSVSRDQTVYKNGSGSIEFTADSSTNFVSSTFPELDGDFTIELWAKPKSTSTSSQFFMDGRAAVATNYPLLYINSSNQISFWQGGTQRVASSAITDTDWKHVALVRAGTILTLYVDGASIGAYDEGTVQTWASGTVYIGRRYAASGSNYLSFDGYIDDFRLTKGIARDIAAEWTAGVYTSPLTNDIKYGSLGRDATTNSNDFTVPANTLTPDDQLIDTPNLRFATLSYTNNTQVTLSNANLTTLSGTTVGRRAVADSGISSGAYYWEVLSQNQNAGLFAGIVNTASPATGNVFIANNNGSDRSHGWYSFNTTSSEYDNGNSSDISATLSAAAVGDIIRVRFNRDTNTLDVAKNNGSWFTLSSSVASGTWYPVFGEGSGSQTSKVTWNFGQDHTFAGSKTPLATPYTDSDGNGEFRYQPPAGFKALATSY